MNLEHAQSLDFSLRKPVAPPAMPPRPTHAADRVRDGAVRALKVSDWLGQEGFDVLSMTVTTFRGPEILIRGDARARVLAETGAATEEGRGHNERGEYVRYRFERAGCAVIFYVGGFAP